MSLFTQADGLLIFALGKFLPKEIVQPIAYLTNRIRRDEKLMVCCFEHLRYFPMTSKLVSYEVYCVEALVPVFEKCPICDVWKFYTYNNISLNLISPLYSEVKELVEKNICATLIYNHEPLSSYTFASTRSLELGNRAAICGLREQSIMSTRYWIYQGFILPNTSTFDASHNIKTFF